MYNRNKNNYNLRKLFDQPVFKAIKRPLLPQMSDYIQHVKTTLTPTNKTRIRIECEKTGTIFWKQLDTGECSWTPELNPLLSRTILFEDRDKLKHET